MEQEHPYRPNPPLTRTTLCQLCAAPWVSRSRPAATESGLEPGSLVALDHCTTWEAAFILCHWILSFILCLSFSGLFWGWAIDDQAVTGGFCVGLTLAWLLLGRVSIILVLLLIFVGFPYYVVFIARNGVFKFKTWCSWVNLNLSLNPLLRFFILLRVGRHCRCLDQAPISLPYTVCFRNGTGNGVSQRRSSSTPNSTHFCCNPRQKHLIQLVKGLMISWQVESGALIWGHTKNMYC
jgi:hypothetical protein